MGRVSADSLTTCPKCHPETLPIGSVWDGYRYGPNAVRENIEYYWETQVDGLHLVFQYRADCWDCGWHYDTTLNERLEL